MTPDSNRELKEYYDKFYQNSEFQYYNIKTTNRFLNAVLEKGCVKAGARILDIGCGTGFYTELLRVAGHEAIGIDISRVGVSKGRGRYPNLQLVVGDTSAMPFTRGSFDALFMNGCSLINTRNMEALRSYVSYLTGYLKGNGVLILLGQSNFSGKTGPNAGWIYHSFDEILSFVNRGEVDVDGPYFTNVRLLSSLNKLALNKLFSSLIKSWHGNLKWTFVYYIRRKKN